MIAIRSALYLIAFYLFTVPLCLSYLPLLLLPSHVMPPFARIWVRGVLMLLRLICGLSWKVEGLEHLPPAPFIVAAKHQSAFETFAFQLVFPGLAFVLKQELTWIPFFGWFLAKTGVIAIDRAAGTRALKSMVTGAQVAKDQGRIILVFPEGTRVRPGQHTTYHTGIAMLYGSLGLPVVPVAVNTGLFWPKRAFLKQPGTIVLKILPPIQPGQDRKSFMTRLETEIETATNHLIEAS